MLTPRAQAFVVLKDPKAFVHSGISLYYTNVQLMSLREYNARRRNKMQVIIRIRISCHTHRSQDLPLGHRLLQGLAERSDVYLIASFTFRFVVARRFIIPGPS